jgi:NADPH2:quinone reductase
MKAIRVHAFGGPEALRFEDVPDPTPRAGEVVVKVEAAGLNFIDIYHRIGLYRMALPLTLGQEAGGVIAALGPDVTGWSVGDRVAYASVVGSDAEYQTVPAQRLVRLPAGVTTRQGAAVMLQGMTAHYLATSTYPLHPGDTCLIHAGAGGVGLLLTQVARLRGARVITTVSTADKAALSRNAGADAVIQYEEEDFETEVKRLTNGEGVQVVYDSVGQATFAKSLNCLAVRGMLVAFGQSSGPIGAIDPLVLSQKGSIFLTRPTLVHYSTRREELLQRATDLFEWIATGTLQVRMEFTFPLAAAADAHRALEARKTTGKVLLIP